MAEEFYRYEGNNILNSNNENVARFEANNIIGELGGGSFEVKSLTYTGTGEEASTIIEFTEKPLYILSMDCNVTSGARVHHFPFVYRESNDIQGVMAFDRGGEGLQYGSYAIAGNNLTITGFADVGARLNESGTITTIYYV